MDCVTCEKCRVWGKLQILGIGTAIKILLHPAPAPAPELAAATVIGATVASAAGASSTAPAVATADKNTCSTNKNKQLQQQGLQLSRQETIALLNTLNQFSNSLIFAAEAADKAGRRDIPEETISIGSTMGAAPSSSDGAGADVNIDQIPVLVQLSIRYGSAALMVIAVLVFTTMQLFARNRS